MTFGVQIYDAAGTTLVFDSTTAIGGVVADYRYYAAGAAGETINYTQWTGYACYLLDCGGAGANVILSTSSGYPSITVTSSSTAMAFTLIVY